MIRDLLDTEQLQKSMFYKLIIERYDHKNI